jgi:beta-glucosidase
MKKHRNLLFIIITFTSLGFLMINQQCSTEAKIEEQAESLLLKMTLEEKIGQMTQVDYTAFKDFNDIQKYFIGSVLWGGSSEVEDISPKGWAEAADKLQEIALKTRLKIPLVLGIDAVHGHNNVNGAVVFPHNIGLGATGNEELVEKASQVTAAEVAGTGMHWTFAPCVAVARNERWGRTYESFGEEPSLVARLGAAAVKGLEGNDLSDKSSILSCTKHYIGDGGTTNGKDQGNTECDEITLRKIHLPGYIEAIKTGTGSIMASYNSWNGEKMHGHKYLMTDVLKKELGFDGFIVSDWAAIDQLGNNYKEVIEKSINAGLDMVMIPNGDDKPNNYKEFIKYLKELVEEGKVSKERIDDAVKRILRIKFKLGLFEKTKTNPDLLSKIGSKEHREVARECVRQSLVLLKNENNTLPLKKDVSRIHFAGRGANSIGMQCGGWTISWQGKMDEVLNGSTTILQAAKNTVSEKTKITYSENGEGAEGADFAVIVVGEEPYAEMFGDRENLNLSEGDLKVIENVKKTGVPIVVVLLTGRPLIINEALKLSNAFVAAWLPGTEGQGVADVLFGDYNPTGKLPRTWPKSMDQIPINIGDKNYDPLFPFGYGLSY